jgi:GNAT superfamily N-acetyltransferase
MVRTYADAGSSEDSGSNAGTSTDGFTRAGVFAMIRPERGVSDDSLATPEPPTGELMSGRIRRLQETDAVAAGSLLARAFLDEPVFIAALPDRADRIRLCAPLFVANVRHACRFGEAWAVQDPDGILRAVAYTVDRPEPALTPEQTDDLGFTALGREWAPALTRLGEFEAAAVRQLGVLPEPWRYLGAIGVEPRWQGHGYGSQLLAHVIATADRMAVGLVTDRERNVTFYERAGMTVMWNGATVEGGPTFWCMATGQG